MRRDKHRPVTTNPATCPETSQKSLSLGAHASKDVQEKRSQRIHLSIFGDRALATLLVFTRSKQTNEFCHPTLQFDDTRPWKRQHVPQQTLAMTRCVSVAFLTQFSSILEKVCVEKRDNQVVVIAIRERKKMYKCCSLQLDVGHVQDWFLKLGRVRKRTKNVRTKKCDFVFAL